MSRLHFHSTSLPGSPEMLSKFEKLRVLSASVQFAEPSVTPSLISCFHNIKVKWPTTLMSKRKNIKFHIVFRQGQPNILVQIIFEYIWIEDTSYFVQAFWSWHPSSWGHFFETRGRLYSLGSRSHKGIVSRINQGGRLWNVWNVEKLHDPPSNIELVP